MEIEPITFGLGLNLRNSPLFLKDGELVSCEGFDFANVGVMDARSSKQTVNPSALGSIHSIHRYRNHVLLGDGGNIRYKWDLDGYCDNYTPPDGGFTYLGKLLHRLIDGELPTTQDLRLLPCRVICTPFIMVIITTAHKLYLLQYSSCSNVCWWKWVSGRSYMVLYIRLSIP